MDASGHGSPFLAVPRAAWVAGNEHAFAIRDGFPVAEGHTLVVPHRVVADLWSLTPAERHSLWGLVDVVVDRLRAALDPAPDGFTIGVNDGPAAGQTVAHVHVHVIPRWHGDVPDPRGGIRHVIPGRGNYLLPEPSTVGGIAPTPAGMMDESAFLQRVLGLLADGRQVATYKPALLLALVDACARRAATGPDPVTIPVPELAELVIDAYWPQVRPYQDLPAHGYRLRQMTGERPAADPAQTGRGEARIPRAVHRLRQSASAQGWSHPAQVRLGDPHAWAATVRDVTEALAKQPIPRLQRPGTWTAASTYPAFLYDDSGFGEHLTAVRAMRMGLTLLPGVAAALVRGAPLLRPAVESAWTAKVAELNQLSTVEESLRAFLFGATRVDLTPVRRALLDHGVSDCFWCGARLRREIHVDHVLPWSQFPTDALFNLVLADPGCNMDKRDTLITPGLLDRWVTRPLDPLHHAGEQLLWPVDRSGTLLTAVAAYTYVPDGVPLWGGSHQHGPATAHARSLALHILRTAA